MDLKEEIENPTTHKRINDILIPSELTKLDDIIDVDTIFRIWQMDRGIYFDKERQSILLAGEN